MSLDNIDNNTPMLDNKNLQYSDTHQPRTTVIKRKNTCIVNIYNIQKELIDNKEQPITRENIPKALQNCNLLRQIKTIQISSNIKYASTQFNSSQLMETFCSEQLT